MTDDIKALRDALAAGPTPGPWRAETYQDHDGPPECDDYAVQATPSTTPRAWETLLTMDWSDAPPRGNRFSRAEAAATRDYIAACSPDRIARLLDALEAATRDAARYWWLRDGHPIPEEMCGCCPMTGDELDAELDTQLAAAIAAHPPASPEVAK
jgi:hypothetical protein